MFLDFFLLLKSDCAHNLLENFGVEELKLAQRQVGREELLAGLVYLFDEHIFDLLHSRVLVLKLVAASFELIQRVDHDVIFSDLFNQALHRLELFVGRELTALEPV